MAAGSFAIFSEKNPWYVGSGTSINALKIDPVGKGKGPKKAGGNNRSAAKSNPEPIHKIFVQLAKLTDDPFWKTTFSDASICKYHRGFNYSGGTLTYKIRNKIFTCPIGELTPEEALPQVMTFMKNTGGVMSKRDNDEQIRNLKRVLVSYKSSYPETWSKVRSEQYKSIIISNFVEDMSLKYSLNTLQENQLENTIRMGITLKAFNSTTIEMDNGLITNIEGLERDKNGFFHIDSDFIPKPKKIKGFSSYQDDILETNTSVIESQPQNNEPSNAYQSLTKKWNKFMDSMAKVECFEEDETS